MLRILLVMSMTAAPLLAIGQSAAPDLDGVLLLGTVVMPAPEEAMAIIQIGESGEQAIYRRDDIVAGGRITAIERNSVQLAFGEREMRLNLVGGAGELIGGTMLLPERIETDLGQSEDGFRLIEQATLDQLGGAIAIESQLISLGAGGVRVGRIDPAGPLRQLGLQRGDLILSVNGQVPNSTASLQAAVAEPMSSEVPLRLEVSRDGQLDLLYYKTAE